MRKIRRARTKCKKVHTHTSAGIPSAEKFGTATAVYHRLNNLPCPQDELLVCTPAQKIAAQVLAFCGFLPGYGHWAKCHDGMGRTAAIDLAASKVGVCRRVVYYWLELPHFIEEIEKQRIDPFFVGLKCLIDAAEAGDVKAGIELVERMSPQLSKQYQLETLRQKGENERLEKLGKYVDQTKLNSPPVFNVTYRTVMLEKYDKETKSEEEAELEKLEAELQRKVARGET